MYFVHLLILFLALLKIAQSLSSYPILIVVSFDAFRHNYFKKQVTPYMEKVRLEGTYADYLENVFPTKTFPNHHSISTGLYPEVHGVVGNSFYDADSEKVIKMSYEMFHYNENIEPIWMLNERISKSRHSGVMMWPGSNFKYQNKTPTFVKEWDPNYSFQHRIDTVISWITNEDTPANLIMLYFEEPDVHGHVYGPESKQVLDILRTLDNITSYLDAKLKDYKIYDKVNIIQLSDHGMSTVRINQIINLKNFLTPNSYVFAGTSPTLHIIPKKEFENEIYESLSNATKTNSFRVFRKKELLERWHFKNNKRVPPIFALADVGFGFQDILDNVPFYMEKYKLKEITEVGIHGYDNKVPNMHPFFMARGPKIRKNYKIAPFKTVDLFNLFCDILELKPTKNNGTYANIEKMVNHSSNKLLTTLAAVVGGILLVILLITCAIVATIITIKRRQSLTTTAALNKRFQQNYHHSIVESQHLLDLENA